MTPHNFRDKVTLDISGTKSVAPMSPPRTPHSAAALLPANSVVCITFSREKTLKTAPTDTPNAEMQPHSTCTRRVPICATGIQQKGSAQEPNIDRSGSGHTITKEHTKTRHNANDMNTTKPNSSIQGTTFEDSNGTATAAAQARREITDVRSSTNVVTSTMIAHQTTSHNRQGEEIMPQHQKQNVSFPTFYSPYALSFPSPNSTPPLSPLYCSTSLLKREQHLQHLTLLAAGLKSKGWSAQMLQRHLVVSQYPACVTSRP